MSLVLNGTDGLSDVDGSAATPAIRGTDANTGIFFPAADTIAFATAGTEDARFDASGNLMIGTTTQISKLTVAGGVALFGGAGVSGNAFFPYYNSATSYNAISSDNSGGMTFITGVSAPSVKATIDSSGNFLLGTTVNIDGRMSILANAGNSGCLTTGNNGLTTYYPGYFYHNGGLKGYISVNSSSTTYASISDYRLKENVQPMQNALARVAALKPVTYKWKVDGSDGQGFIAHELQAVCPDAVVGEKDAVKEDGSIKPQGIDTSFLVATLTAAIQEQQAIITALTARVEALEGTQP
jgi:hypothetical protein